LTWCNKFAILASAVEITANTLKGKTMINLETKTGKAFKAMVLNGEKLTASEARKRFGIGNLSAEASRIRQAGFAIYANSRKAGNGVTVTEYVHGKPSRKVVAAGYKALAMGLV
jgi:hypothetical protein